MVYEDQIVVASGSAVRVARSWAARAACTSAMWVSDQCLIALTTGRRVWPRVDAALDAALVGVSALDAVRDKGSFVAVAAGAAPAPLRGTRVHNVWIRTDGPRLAELAAMADARQLTPRVAATLPLEEVAAAHRRVAAGGLRGRIVLTLKP